MIDCIVLLMEGRSIFSGRREQVLEFFKEKMKYRVPRDYIMQERSMYDDEQNALKNLMEIEEDDHLDGSSMDTPSTRPKQSDSTNETNEQAKPTRKSSTGDLSRRRQVSRANSTTGSKNSGRPSRRFSIDVITPIRGQRNSKRKSSAVFRIEARNASRRSTSRVSVYALQDEERRGVVDFLTDVITRMERPENSRYAYTAEEIQNEFLASEFNVIAPRMGMEEFEDSAHNSLHISFGSEHSDPEARLVPRNEIKAYPESLRFEN